jgi:hypothetical protein
VASEDREGAEKIRGEEGREERREERRGGKRGEEGREERREERRGGKRGGTRREERKDVEGCERKGRKGRKDIRTNTSSLQQRRIISKAEKRKKVQRERCAGMQPVDPPSTVEKRDHKMTQETRQRKWAQAHFKPFFKKKKKCHSKTAYPFETTTPSFLTHRHILSSQTENA